MKTYEVRDTAPGLEELLATFTVDDDGDVTADYYSDQFKREVENGLVWSADLRRGLTLSDGQAFIEGLIRQFANSTFIDVSEV